MSYSTGSRPYSPGSSGMKVFHRWAKSCLLGRENHDHRLVWSQGFPKATRMVSGSKCHLASGFKLLPDMLFPAASATIKGRDGCSHHKYRFLKLFFQLLHCFSLFGQLVLGNLQ